MELTLKHIFDRDIEPALKDITKLLKIILSLGNQSFTEAILIYILDRGCLKDKTKLVEYVKNELSEKVGEKMATIAEQFWAEGLEKGIEKGVEKEKIEIAKRLLLRQDPIASIAEVTGLSSATIEKLKHTFTK